MRRYFIALFLCLIPAIANAEFITPLGRVNPETTVQLTDEFIGGSLETGEIGELGWAFTNPTVTHVDGVSNHPGIKNIASAATTGNISSFHLGTSQSAGSIDPDEYFDITYIVRPQTNTLQELRVGMQIGYSASPATGGIYFIHDTNTPNSSETGAANPTTTEWACVTRSSSTSTLTDANVTVSTNTWYKLRIRRLSATQIEFFIDGASVCTHSTNIPTTAELSGIQIEPLEDVSKTTDVDYFHLEVNGITR